MNRKNILKDAGVLLVASLMILSTVLVTGNKLENDKPEAIDSISNINKVYTPCVTEKEIWDSIDKGIAWLAKQQCLFSTDYVGADYRDWGGWGFEDYSLNPIEFVGNAAITCLALIKLQDYAYETSKWANPSGGSHANGDWTSPFDTRYPYYNNVVAGWKYLFRPDTTTPGMYTAHVYKQVIGAQFHGFQVDVPDFGWPSSGNGYGLFVSDPLWKAWDYVHFDYETYSTGIFLLALVASGQPSLTILPAVDPMAAANYNAVNIDVNGVSPWDSFKEVAQDAVDWLAFAQSDGFDFSQTAGLDGRGGWSYKALDNIGITKSSTSTGSLPDNSNTGYAVLGLAAAESKLQYYATPYYTNFGCIVPDFVKTEMHYWIKAIQDPVDGYSPSQNPHQTNYDDGGSWYRPNKVTVAGKVYGDNWEDYDGEFRPNILKTGNLIFEMIFCVYPDPTARDNAVDFIERHWRDTTSFYYKGKNVPHPGWGYNANPLVQNPYRYANYESMFCVMKGFQYAGIGDITINLGGGTSYTFPWYNINPPATNTPPYDDFASVIVSQQDPNNGYWNECSHFNENEQLLSTLWALLTLEKIPKIPSPHLRKWAELGFTKIVTTEKKCVWPGDTFYYYIQYDNSASTVDVPGVTIVDQFPILPIRVTPIDAWINYDGNLINFVPAWKATRYPGHPLPWESNQYEWDVGTVPAGAKWTLKVLVQVDPEGKKSVKIKNIAWATATGMPTLYASNITQICNKACIALDFATGVSKTAAVRFTDICMSPGIYNIDWAINLNGGIIRQGRETTGTVSYLPKNESIVIQSGKILGFGSVNITLVITAACTIVEAYTKGFVFGQNIFVFPSETNLPSIEGSWLLSTFDFQGNKTKDQGVHILTSGYDVSITDDQTQDILFKGKLEIDEQSELWIINSSSTPPYENPLTITKIFIHDDTYMVSDMPLFESLNPYQFTRTCCS